MKKFSVVNRSTSKDSIFRSSKDRTLAHCWRLATMMLFFCASAEGARPIPLGVQKEAQKFTVSAGSIELALLQVVEQSGHQLIMQGMSNSPTKSYDYTGSDTLPELLGKLLLQSGLEFEILANNIVLINAEKQIKGNGITLSHSERAIKDTLSWLEEELMSAQQQGSYALDVSFGLRVRSAPAVGTVALLRNEDIRSLDLNLSFSQIRGTAQSSLETEGMRVKMKGNANMVPEGARGINIIKSVTELTQNNEPIQNVLKFEAFLEQTSYFGIPRYSRLSALSNWQPESSEPDSLPKTVSREIELDLEAMFDEQAAIDGGVSFIQASYPAFAE